MINNQDRNEFSSGDEYQQDKKPKKLSKNSQIYGIWNQESDESGSEKEDFDNKPHLGLLNSYNKGPALKSSGYLNFQKSDQILYDATKEIQIKYAKKPEKVQIIAQNSKTSPEKIQDFEEIEINDKNDKEKLKKQRIFDFKRKNDLKVYDFPEQLGYNKNSKKIKKESEQLENKDEAKKLQAQYGKGFTMLSHLGFEIGKGLGKEKQGRLDPLQAIRKTAYNSNYENRLDNKEKKQLKFEEKLEKNNEKNEYLEKDNDQTGIIIKRWKKNKKKGKKKMMKPEEINDGSKIKNLPMKIIDMRGKEINYFEDFSIVKNIQNESNEKKIVLSELILHIKGNYEKEKHVLKFNDRQKKHQEDIIMTNKYELENLEKEITENRLKIKEINDIKDILDYLKDKENKLNSFEIEEIIKIFDKTCSGYRNFILEYNLHYYFIKILALKLSITINKFSIKSYFERNYDNFNEINSILKKLFFTINKKNEFYDNEIENQISKKKIDLSLSLLYENSIFPILRTYVCNEWNVKYDGEILIDLLDKYKLIFPTKLLNELIQTIILPRIDREIQNWDPTKDSLMVHLWIHPWLKIIDIDLFKNIFKIISKTLISTLQKWNPNDKTAFLLIKPWKNVFDNEIWNSIINRAILPKLFYEAYQLKIEPNNQKIDGVRAIIEWSELLNKEQLIMLIEPILEKIMKTIRDWLCKPIRNNTEINICINGWKNLLEKICFFCEKNDFFENLLSLNI